MMKSSNLNTWLWKWHIIAGLVCVPFMLLLAITGSVYLFKDIYNDNSYADARFVSHLNNEKTVSYDEQLKTAVAHISDNQNEEIVSITIPERTDKATSFQRSGNGRAADLIYVNPYSNEVTGIYKQTDSLMYTVRKLHGELLLGGKGTLVVELVASWFVVMLISGLYVWWPSKGFSVRGFFLIRSDKGRRMMWRDVHAVIGFWVSLFMLAILAGGMPWTELFGDNLKWVQSKTDTGYPQYWQSSRGLTSDISVLNASTPLGIEEILKQQDVANLTGQLTIALPEGSEGVYTVKNHTQWLSDQRVIHIDQYSGNTIVALGWNSVGILMELRQVFMRFHQGQYGIFNLIAVLLVVQLFALSLIASLVSYFKRKPKGSLGIPKVPAGFNIGVPIFIAIVLLGFLFPAFGISLVCIFVIEKARDLIKPKLQTQQ